MQVAKDSEAKDVLLKEQNCKLQRQKTGSVSVVIREGVEDVGV